MIEFSFHYKIDLNEIQHFLILDTLCNNNT